LSRIETMVLMAGIELPIRAIRDQIKSAVNIIIQQSRLSDGTRKVVAITEVTGIESDIITTQDIFRFIQTRSNSGKIESEFQATTIIPTFIEEIRNKGIQLDLNIFKKC